VIDKTKSLMNNEERLEKTIAKAHMKGWGNEIFSRAEKYMKDGESQYSAFDKAYHDLKRENEKNLPSNSLYRDARK
jgi:hypothetical protein